MISLGGVRFLGEQILNQTMSLSAISKGITQNPEGQQINRLLASVGSLQR